MEVVINVIKMFCVAFFGGYLLFTTKCSAYQDGVCDINSSFEKFCCSGYELKNGICTKCQVGFHSEKKLTCKKCAEGNYGEKCGKTCKCNSNEWCNHIEGCVTRTRKENIPQDPPTTSLGSVLVVKGGLLVKNKEAICRIKSGNSSVKHMIHHFKQPTINDGHKQKDAERLYDEIKEKYMINFDDTERSTPSVKNKEKGDIIISITIRELIFIIIIIILSLIILFGLLQKYSKRQSRTLISPINHNEIETHEIREVEDRTESVYHEIDESAMNTLSPRQLFHHSNLEIRNSRRSTIQTRAKNNNSLERVSSESQLVRQTCPRRQRCSIEGSSNDINSAVRNEYSDGYLLPITRSIAKLRTLKTFSENRETLFRNNDKITSKPNDECIIKESTGIGICRSMSYTKLVLKDIRTTRIDIVDNSTYSETVHLDPKYTTLSPRRRTL